MKYSELHLNNFSHGYDSTSSPEKLPDNSFSLESSNVSLTTEGAVQKRFGYRKALTNAGSSWTTYSETLGLAQFHDPGNHRALVRLARNTTTADLRVESNTGQLPQADVADWSAGVSLGSVSSAEQFAQFSSYFGRLYFACPGLSDLKYLDYSGGAFAVTTVTASGSTRTLDKPEGCELWYDRIWTYMDRSVERGSFLMYTNIDGTTIDLDNDWQEIPGDGPITGIVRVGRNLLVFKPRETFLLSGGEDPVSLLKVDQLSRDVGCIAPRSIVSVDNDVFFLSERGLYWTNGHQVKFIGENVENDFRSLDRNSTKRVHAVHNRKESQIVIWIPKAFGEGLGYGLMPYENASEGYGSGEILNTGYAYDYKNGGWCSPYTNQEFHTSCVYVNNVSTSVEEDEIVVVGGIASNDYHLYEWGYGDTDDGVMVNAKVVTHPFDFGDPAQRKIIRKIYSQVGEVGADVPLRTAIYSEYGTPVTQDTTGLQKTTSGSPWDPNYTQTRHTVGAKLRHARFSIEDYDDGTDEGGRWVLAGFVVLYSAAKGRRT